MNLSNTLTSDDCTRFSRQQKVSHNLKTTFGRCSKLGNKVKSPRKTKNSLRKQEQKTDTKTENTNGNINENQPKKELLNIEATAS